jgi:hypothetical protein
MNRYKRMDKIVQPRSGVGGLATYNGGEAATGALATGSADDPEVMGVIGDGRG